MKQFYCLLFSSRILLSIVDAANLEGVDGTISSRPWTFPLDRRWSPVQRHHDDFPEKKRLSDQQCRPEAHLCVGPGKLYPLGRQIGVQMIGTFTVPPLPEIFDDVENTYYDYLNIFWTHNRFPGFMNQFVPQLMLGNALAYSSNFPLYIPQWIQLQNWHIGAQYFMEICNSNATMTSGYDCDSRTMKAATGNLISVDPGEGIYTIIELVHKKTPKTTTHKKKVEWHLTTGVIGDSHRISRVIVPQPFMGLVPQTQDWMEEIYDNVYVGSCLENYGMTRPQNYPRFWRLGVTIKTPNASTTMWDDWKLSRPNDCEWQPRSSVRTTTDKEHQIAYWEAWIHDESRHSSDTT